MRSLLAVNAGSSSLKLSLFDADADGLTRIAHERFEGLDHDEARRASVEAGIADWAQRHGGELVAAGHRVVHGGVKHSKPVLVDDNVLAELEALVPLAPLHQPHSLAPIRSLRAGNASLMQVACFDTAFHRGRPSAAERYGLPDELWQAGIRRYGFHGLSYEYVVSAFGTMAPNGSTNGDVTKIGASSQASGRVIVAHLGNGASLCAVRDGRCVDTTMGFSTLSGLVMSTRCGELDAGAVLHLLRDGARTTADVEDMLYRKSGLRGISGTSGDVRDLLADESAAAREALDCFVLGITRAIGSLTAVLGGLDAVVFTAGIGENSAEIRARVCRAAAWTGLVLDEDANSRGGPCLSAAESKVSAWVVPTDEERMIAMHVRGLIA